MFHDKDKTGVLPPGLGFHALSEAVWSVLSELYFVVSLSLSGEYVLLSWTESHVLILSGGGKWH